MTSSSPTPMDPEDVAIGFPLGYERRPPRFNAVGVPGPRAAIEEVVLGALQRQPCVVGFSGGRDSSAVLAVAVHVARKHGLPDPLPVTRVFTDAPATEEGDWQELVIRHLGIDEWVREQVDDELDVVGPLAAPRLRRYGVLWPAPLHGDDYFLRHARGGSVLDGEGGDNVCDPYPHRMYRVAHVLRRRKRPNPQQLRGVVGALAPSRLRGRHAARRGLDVPQPWLRPAFASTVAERWGAHVAAEPLDVRRSIMSVLASRSVVSLQRNRAFFAGLHDVRFVSPFLDPAVAAAIAAAGGRLGFPHRTAGLGSFCGDLLPEALLVRGTKAEFNAAFFNRHAQEFAERWTGAGIDHELVDADVLRAQWSGPQLNYLSAVLLQAAWLADERRRP